MVTAPQSKLRLAAALLLAILSGANLRLAAGQNSPTLSPLRAEITAPVDASWAKPGTRIRARATHEWTAAGCHLRTNDEIEGHVAGVMRHSKSQPTSTMQIVFDRANCDHRGMVTANLVVVALIAPAGSERLIGQTGLGQAPPLTGLPLSIDGAGAAPMRSVETAAALNQYFVTGNPDLRTPEKMSLGQVIGLPGTRLQVTPGGVGGSIVSGLGKDARLEGRTTLILLAVRQPTSTRSAAAGSASPAGTAPAPTQ